MEQAVPESKPKQQFTDPTAGPLLSVRFIVALVMMAIGIAWILYYYLAVRVDTSVLNADGSVPKPGGPNFMGDLGEWNYLIGFGLFFLGLIISAHPKTPLGRGRGVVVGMLGCFVLGLIWICTFYVISDDVSEVAIFNDLGQKNLMVGIAFMAVGFTFATRWE
jgi:drug/metabolite transporter (DMT)-like permease